MDLREKKTRNSIKNAFIELRAKKQLERITVKELCELAMISKATFYLHYNDIYDLSDCLQKEIIQSVLENITSPELILTDSTAFTKELFNSFAPHENLIEILFSDTQASVLPTALEEAIRNKIFLLAPHLKDNPKLDIILSYKIQGGYYAYLLHRKKYDYEYIVDVVGNMASFEL